MFYAEIQEGHQKWREINFWQKLPVDCAYTVRVKNFIEIALSCKRFQDKCVFAFYSVIQDDHQKWQKFLAKSSTRLCTFRGGQKSYTISEINGFLDFSSANHDSRQTWQEINF